MHAVILRGFDLISNFVDEAIECSTYEINCLFFISYIVDCVGDINSGMVTTNCGNKIV